MLSMIIEINSQGRRETSEAPGQKRRRGPLRAKRAVNYQGQKTKYEKLLLVYFMRPPYLEALDVPGAICPLCPLSAAL